MSWDAGGGDTWDSGATASGDNTWNDGGAAEPVTNGYEYGSHAGGETDSHSAGDFAEGAGGSGGGLTGACFNCGEVGHNKSDCPNPARPRPCFNCGEEGHNKAECTNPTVPREFTGTCKLCGETGHRVANCPAAPPKLCDNCKEEGHGIVECKNARKIDREHIEDIAPEVAWQQLKAGSEDRDLDDIKSAINKYIKATPDATYVQLEKAFRSQNLNIYLIAIEKELAITYTNMDLQGNLDRKFTVSWRLSPNPKRPKEKEGWPATPEENIERLADAGEPVDRGIPKCGNCEELGHMSKSCPQEKQENTDKPVVKCYNCDEVGHRVRDCPTPRPDKFACRNCNKSGHSSKEFGHFSRDCPQGGGGGFACRNCGQDGHKAAECTEPRKMICRNCDEEGHTGRECPKPRDYSRVKCSNCGEMGHTKVRCKNPAVAEEGGDSGGHGADTGGYVDDAGGYGGDADAGGYGAAAADSGW